jgi:hypothetical protein
MKQVGLRGGGVAQTFAQEDGSGTEMQFDHVTAATGYRVSLQRLHFMNAGLREEMATVEDIPILNRNFESSVPGLYFVGLASSTSFGPLCRFAYGARFTLEAFGPAPRPYSLERHCLVVTSQVTRFGTEGNFGAEA